MRHHLYCFTYEITGKSGHDRISKLLPPHWIDLTNDTSEDDNANDQHDLITSPDFLWENEYDRRCTRHYRSRVKCYSHLPNGSLLDDKWALAELFYSSSFSRDSHPKNDENFLFSDAPVSVLPSYCFQGSQGFYEFALQVGMLPLSENGYSSSVKPTHQRMHPAADDLSNPQQPSFVELLTVCSYAQRQKSSDIVSTPAEPNNIWVVKDAATNGAGGIWIVSPANVSSFHSFLETQSYKQQKHRYVAQKYAWPPILYHGRKFHVRIYSVMTADASIYVHRLCFLHVANDPFFLSSDDSDMPATVHITNCCANSDDVDKFSGEIVATLFEGESGANELNEEYNSIDLSPFFPSISASIQKVLVDFFPFVSGGAVNGGFEYMGLDFLLSYECADTTDTANSTIKATNLIPTAYLLEINAPPSQGTATGLPSAEKVHDTVLKDFINLWVRPCLERVDPIFGGWKLVGKLNNTEVSMLSKNYKLLTFHQASMMNRIRWKLFEFQHRKNEEAKCAPLQLEEDRSVCVPLQNSFVESTSKRQEEERSENSSNRDRWTKQCQHLSCFVRQSFPYFRRNELKDAPVFLESGGGSQVPQAVIDTMTLALSHRDRSTIGFHYKDLARKYLKSFLGISNSIQDQYEIFLGSNASSLLAILARKYVSLLSNEDEIVIAEHNHEANITPWVELAKASGAKIRWWGIGKSINVFLSSRTRIVALSHASNVLGCVYDIRHISELARCASDGKARVVVDGVAAVPHRPALMAESGVDWYVISCHKCFGPHIGALCGRVNAVKECNGTLCQSSVTMQVLSDSTDMYNSWECGTVNYEACAGVLGLGVYLQLLVSMKQELPCPLPETLSVDTITKAYEKIWSIEAVTKYYLLNYLYSCPNVQVLEEPGIKKASYDRLPIISFVHKTLNSLSIVQWCSQHMITCRNGIFLSTKVLEHFRVHDMDNGIVRFSLAHYNTLMEVEHVIAVLSEMEGWSS